MSSGGGNQTTTSSTQPYAPAEPYLQDILGEAQNIYRSDVGRSFFPGSTVVPFANQTQEALNLQQAQSLEQMAPSAMLGQAGNTFGQFAASPQSSYGGLTPQADYLTGIRQGITSDVMGEVQSQFGGMGRTGTSPQAQQAAARGITQAYAPIAAELGSQERGREMSGMESAYGRQLQAAGQLPGMQQQMDMRRQQGIASLGGVGSAYENLAQRQMQDQIARFQFGQQAPINALNQYAGLISPIASGLPSRVDTSPNTKPGAVGGAFGGAIAGSAIPGGFGVPLGALAGGLGFL
jgi:hypothetical protein